MLTQASDFIANLDAASTAADVLTAMDRLLVPHGFDRLVFTGLTDAPFEDDILATNWAAEFLDLFVREDYIRYDPIARRCRQSAMPFAWRTADFKHEPEPRAFEVMERAAEFGLAEGFIVPIHGPHGLEGCVGMAGRSVDLAPMNKPALHVMALYGFERARGLVGPRRRCRPPLTRREREVLAWVAEGKSAWEVGEILSISKRTVDEHAQTAVRKLGAANRTHAVAIALRDRIIEV